MSHDLRSPLSAIVMAADVLLRGAVSGEALSRLQRHADIIARNAQQMTRMIDDLLDISSIEAGRLSVTRAPEAPPQLVLDAVARSDAPARERGLSLRSELAGELPRVSCDRDRVAQIFANLLDNAIRVTGPGGSIVVRAEARSGEVLFSVSDTGPGIAAEEMAHLFEPYRRGARPGYRGAGLGLAIVQGLVAAHGGKVWVESEAGKGSTFFFTLPAEGGAGHGSEAAAA
ncbi:MAG: HAMP domain-containing histidine kinase [Polyangiaceae bacterium]|nr:HAMP domain-containing histidine kinase [Polyangiaceae bacterium]